LRFFSWNVLSIKVPIFFIPILAPVFAAQSLKSKIATALRLSPASKAFTIFV
jgi:hypothetical protein